MATFIEVFEGNNKDNIHLNIDEIVFISGMKVFMTTKEYLSFDDENMQKIIESIYPQMPKSSIPAWSTANQTRKIRKG